MDTKVFIYGKSALDILRRARVLGRRELLRPSRVKTLAGCACGGREVADILAGAGPDARSVMPEGLGLHDNPVHVAVEDQAGRTRASGVVAHVQPGLVLPGTYLQLTDNILILSAEACYARIAPRLSVPRRVALAMELMGTYSFSPADDAYCFDLAAITTSRWLAAYCSRLPHAHGSMMEGAIESLKWAAQNSASPMETIVAALLTLPYRHGGYGIEPPLMNVALDSRGNVVPPDTPGCRKPDLVWLDRGLALEYNGRESHNGLDDYERDSDRRDELEGMGMRVIPISAGKLYDVDRFHMLACEVAKATGKRLRLPAGFEGRRASLRSSLLLRRAR